MEREKKSAVTCPPHSESVVTAKGVENYALASQAN